MILDRLTVRERVNVLALIPLLVVVVLHVPLVASRLDQARAATETVEAARAARQVSLLIEIVQRARLLSVAYQTRPGVSPNALTVLLAEVEDERTALLDDESILDRPALARALDGAQRLTDVGVGVQTRRLTGLQSVDAYGEVIDTLVDALGLAGDTAASTEGMATLGALDGLLRSDEAASRRAALLLVATTDPVQRTRAVVASRELEIVEDTTADQFERLAPPYAAAMFELADQGQAASRLTAVETWLVRARATPVPVTLAAEVYAAAQSQTESRQLVQTQITRLVSETAAEQLRLAWLTTAGLSFAGLSILVAVVLLSIVVGRSVSRPLRRLTDAAVIVADLAQEELLRVADEDAEDVRVPRLSAIDLRTQDEIGDLAAAFNRVQATAALLLERQVVSRRNVASMFSSMGRRTSNLVARQLALIDTLERAEEDPATLSTLYRLDHTATRLRRNASSLVVLSGGTENLGEGQPMPVGDVVRAALGTVEDYQRVSLRRLPKLWVAPGAVGDLALLLAELLDNAVSFSPPRTQVEVVGTMTRDGACTLSVIDHGMGMPPDRMTEENGRLRRRERLDLAPSDVLGLFVVGRIARRHGIDVRLEATPPTGVTAVVALPAALMVDGRAVAPGTRTGSAARQRQATAAAGATRRELAARAGVRPAPLAAPPGARAGGGGAGAGDVEGAATGRPAGTTPAPASAPSGDAASGDTSAAVTPSGDPPADVPAAATGRLAKRVRGSHWTDHSPPGPAATAATAAAGAGGAATGGGPPVPPIPPAPVPPAPPGGEGLARRVPGSHLAGLEVEAPSAEGSTGTAPGRQDPEAVRRQLVDVERALERAQQVADHGEPEPPPPPVAEVARRSGLTRRVPGAALDTLGDVPAAPPRDVPGRAGGPGPVGGPARAGRTDPPTSGIDADLLRQELDAVDDALQRARQVAPPSPVTAERRSAQAAEAALREAEGRLAEQRQTVEAVADSIATGSLALPGMPPPDAPPPDAPADPAPTDPAPTDAAPTDAAPAVPVPEDAAPERPLVRRVPGATLGSTGSGTRDGLPSARRARPGVRGSSVWAAGPASGPIAIVPERPEDVLAWAEDLEAAMARLPEPAGDGEQQAGRDPGEQAGTEGENA